MDKSINCGSAYDLINNIENKLKQNHTILLQNILQQPLIYIATNEKNQTVLDILHQKGYYTSKFIKNYLELYQIKLNSLDLFVIELIFMCKSLHNFYWGNSGIHDLVNRCRSINRH